MVPGKLYLKGIRYIDSKEDFCEMISILETADEIAIDLEHHGLRTFQGFTCLAQISTRSFDFVVDCIMLRSDLHLLNKVTCNPLILKVFHGASSDVKWLQKDFGVYLVSLLDTYEVSRYINNLRSRSLGSLLYEYCSVSVDKSLQTCDWRQRPLSKAHIEYAASDTHYLLHLKDLLLLDLQVQCSNEGVNYAEKIIFIVESCKNLTLSTYTKPNIYGRHFELIQNELVSYFHQESHFGIKVFEYLWAKRDELGRKYDESLNYIMYNKDLKNLVKKINKFKDSK